MQTQVDQRKKREQPGYNQLHHLADFRILVAQVQQQLAFAQLGRGIQRWAQQARLPANVIPDATG